MVELYTSEGCSSCPPADKWLSTLKSKTIPTSSANSAVIQAFHVNYWDYIGWPDRFATPAHTNRQRQISAWNKQNGIYTPQMVLNGQDWRGWGGSSRNVTASTSSSESAKSSISLQQTGADQFEAVVSPVAGSSGVAATPGHERQVNLVVFDPKTGKTLQAVSANCPS